MKVIGIAVVEHRGSYLLGTRPPGAPLAGYAEFPGGKCLPGELPEQCACRECREETGLAVTPIRLLLNHIHEYPHGTVDLYFWLCRPADSKQITTRHHGFHWVPAAELPMHKFPDANAALVEMLVALR